MSPCPLSRISTVAGTREINRRRNLGGNVFGALWWRSPEGMDLEKRRFGEVLFVMEILNESCKNQCPALTTLSIWGGGVATSPPFPVWCVVPLASGFCGSCSSQQAQQAQRSRVPVQQLQGSGLTCLCRVCPHSSQAWSFQCRWYGDQNLRCTDLLRTAKKQASKERIGKGTVKQRKESWRNSQVRKGTVQEQSSKGMNNTFRGRCSIWWSWLLTFLGRCSIW